VHLGHCRSYHAIHDRRDDADARDDAKTVSHVSDIRAPPIPVSDIAYEPIDGRLTA